MNWFRARQNHETAIEKKFRFPDKLGWLLTFWLLAALPAPAQPTNPPPVSLEEVSRAMAKANTVFTHFVQERHLALFNEPLRSEGCLCFEKPGRVRWEITSPYQSILVSDGSGVAQFEWVDEKWKKLDAGLAGAMQAVIAQIAAVMEGRYASDNRDYTVTLAASPEGPGHHARAAQRDDAENDAGHRGSSGGGFEGHAPDCAAGNRRGFHGHPLQRTGRRPRTAGADV